VIRFTTVRAIAVGLAAFCCMAWIHASPSDGAEKRFTSRERLAAIRRAQVWKATDVAAKDLKKGPTGEDAFVAGQTVTCDYAKHPLGGSTPKFWCALTPEDVVKVRYGNHNGEVYGQVAAARLLWALGFGANRTYPVKVACRDCPWDPYAIRQREAGQPDTILFDPATIDRKMDGATLETKPDEGWAWKELDLVDEAAGGAPRAQRDALKLLAVLIQHTDTKASNQRLLCLDGRRNEPCAEPFMMITDLGTTFGRANEFSSNSEGSLNLKNWSHTPVWEDADRPGCIGKLSKSIGGTLSDPHIGEAGRKFLADLLAQLSDAQLHDLFDVAGFTRRDPNASVDQWIEAFKEKRSEIVNRTCP